LPFEANIDELPLNVIFSGEAIESG